MFVAGFVAGSPSLLAPEVAASSRTSAGDFLRVPVTWYDYFPTGASVSYTVRVGLDGVMEADDIEFGPG